MEVEDQKTLLYHCCFCKNTTKIKFYCKFKKKIRTLKFVWNFSVGKVIFSIISAFFRINIETGRYNYIPFVRRHCTLCNMNQIENDLHLISIAIRPKKKFFVSGYPTDPKNT